MRVDRSWPCFGPRGRGGLLAIARSLCHRSLLLASLLELLHLHFGLIQPAGDRLLANCQKLQCEVLGARRWSVPLTDCDAVEVLLELLELIATACLRSGARYCRRR